jgi:hypothetical protein
LFRWTDTAVAKLRVLAARGLKSAEIGDILGCSHDTVIRKCGVEGVPLGPRIKLRPKPLGLELLPMTERIGVGRAVAALRANDCRWPIGSPGEPDFHFCSQPKINMQFPYCKKHQDVAAGNKVLK